MALSKQSAVKTRRHIRRHAAAQMQIHAQSRTEVTFVCRRKFVCRLWSMNFLHSAACVSLRYTSSNVLIQWADGSGLLKGHKLSGRKQSPTLSSVFLSRTEVNTHATRVIYCLFLLEVKVGPLKLFCKIRLWKFTKDRLGRNSTEGLFTGCPVVLPLLSLFLSLFLL